MTQIIISKSEAKLQGLKRYFTGKPCKHGHIAERSVADNDRCFSCIRIRPDEYEEKRKKYCLARSKIISLNNKLYREKHKDKLNEHSRQWRKNNLERQRLYSRKKTKSGWDKKYRAKRSLEKRRVKEKWRKDNFEKIQLDRKIRKKETKIAWNRKNSDRVRIHKKTNRINSRENYRRLSRAYKARKRAAKGSHTVSEVMSLMKKQKHKCIECNVCISMDPVKNQVQAHLDHIMPLKLGGSNDITNLQFLCYKCNIKKGACDPIVWARLNGRLL